MPRIFHVAVLECDTPIDTVQAQYGSYGDIFEAFLRRGVSQLPLGMKDVELRVSKWDVVEAQRYPNLEAIDGLLITGSKHCASDSEPWISQLVEYVRVAYRSGRIRTLGVCFGHQIIARSLGARVERNEAGWEVSVKSLQLTPEGSNLLGGLQSLTLHQMHRDIVVEVPGGVVNLATSGICKVQGLYLPNRVLSTQAHPEFNEVIMLEILASRHKSGTFDQDLFRDGQARATLHHDGNMVASVFCDFLLHI